MRPGCHRRIRPPSETISDSLSQDLDFRYIRRALAVPLSRCMWMRAIWHSSRHGRVGALVPRCAARIYFSRTEIGDESRNQPDEKTTPYKRKTDSHAIQITEIGRSLCSVRSLSSFGVPLVRARGSKEACCRDRDNFRNENAASLK